MTARDRAIEAVTRNLASTVNLRALPPEALATFAVDELLRSPRLLDDLAWHAPITSKPPAPAPASLAVERERGRPAPSDAPRAVQDTKPGDLIQVVNVATPDDDNTLSVGQRHVVESVGSTPSGEYVTLVGQPVALVESVGDRWAVVGVDHPEWRDA